MRQPPNQEWVLQMVSQVEATDIFCFLYLDGVSVTTGTVRQYLDPTEGSRKYADTLGELDRPAEALSAGLVSAPLGEEEQCSTK